MDTEPVLPVRQNSTAGNQIVTRDVMDETKLKRRSPISMRSIGRFAFAVLALLILAVVSTLLLRSRSPHFVAGPVTSQGLLPGDLELQSKNFAGPEALDCGRVLLHGDPKIATECALSAQKAGKPFRVRYDLQGIDSFVAVAIVRTQVGTVESLMWDDPSGGGGRGVVFPRRCPEPVHLSVNPNGRLDCIQEDSSPPKEAMPPNAKSH
jgi:hypothetical protein